MYDNSDDGVYSRSNSHAIFNVFYIHYTFHNHINIKNYD